MPDDVEALGLGNYRRPAFRLDQPLVRNDSGDREMTVRLRVAEQIEMAGMEEVKGSGCVA